MALTRRSLKDWHELKAQAGAARHSDAWLAVIEELQRAEAEYSTRVFNEFETANLHRHLGFIQGIEYATKVMESVLKQATRQTARTGDRNA